MATTLDPATELAVRLDPALLMELAGFEPEARHADWAGAEFTAESRSHVSVYRLPAASQRHDYSAELG